MKQTESEIYFKFYQIIIKDLSLDSFEKWLYDAPEIEEYFGTEFYFDLLNINYKKKYSLHELENVIFSKIPFDVFEKTRLENLLEGIINSSCDLAKTLSEMYDDYCNGYNFFRYLGLSYVLNGIDEVPRMEEKLTWNEQEFKERRQVLNAVSDNLVKEARRILRFLVSGEIVITNRYEYCDNRKYEDRLEINSLESMYKKTRNKG